MRTVKTGDPAGEAASVGDRNPSAWDPVSVLMEDEVLTVLARWIVWRLTVSSGGCWAFDDQARIGLRAGCVAGHRGGSGGSN